MVEYSYGLAVTTILPLQRLDPELVENGLAYIHKRLSQLGRNQTVLVLKVNHSRALWRALAPSIYESERATGIRVLSHMLRSINFPKKITAALTNNECERGDKQFATEVLRNPKLVRKRRLVIRMRATRKPTQKHSVLFWIEPPSETRHESAFEGRLITWEHKLIRAQSLTGYYATLGGGFFLCHHFATAIHLAQQQKRMALLLNDYGMYYRCILNTAYNFVYAGHFRVANRLIRYVWKQTQNLVIPDPALVKMCYSARVFSKRMKQASRTERDSGFLADGENGTDNLSENNVNSLSKTVDDLARIRIFRDHSLSDDLVIPFGTHQNANTLYSECL